MKIDLCICLCVAEGWGLRKFFGGGGAATTFDSGIRTWNKKNYCPLRPIICKIVGGARLRGGGRPLLFTLLCENERKKFPPWTLDSGLEGEGGGVKAAAVYVCARTLHDL